LALLSGYVFQMDKFPGTLRGLQDRERGVVLAGFSCRQGGDGHRF
jgi:hypothetical protein